MDELDTPKYRAISTILNSPSAGSDARPALAEALKAAMKALSVKAASLVLFEESRGQPLPPIEQGDEGLLRLLKDFERQMISEVGDESEQISIKKLYATIDHEGSKSLFSYLVKLGKAKKVGVISGICDGDRNISLEEEFIDLIATALRRRLMYRWVEATLSDRINNLLTPILGFAQVGQGETNLTKIREYLESIEKSGLEIKKVMEKLRNGTLWDEDS